MNTKTLEKYLLLKKYTVKEFPFGPDVAVFKVMGKMFALVALENELLRISLKCDPDEALVLRLAFEAIQPGYHLNKEHWNTVTFDGSIPKNVVLKMIDDSYLLVVKGLRKADRMKIEGVLN